MLIRLMCLLLLIPLCLPLAALARQDCEQTSLFRGSTLNVRIDNDLFGGARQDQGYSNGFLVSLVSPNLTDYLNDPCLPAGLRKINRYLHWLQPGTPEELNMTIGIGQAIYTPRSRSAEALIPHDRPYAGALLASLGYHARYGQHLQSSQIRIGMVGPAALGGAVQNEWHRRMGIERFRGWKNQLHNEPVFQLIHERRWRWPEHDTGKEWNWDIIAHAGGSVGNFASYANAGLEWRFGYRLPDDFGTAPLHPAGENTAPHKPAGGRHAGWAGHLFVALDGRWVLRDITLDGNTFRASHSVSKRPLVGDIGYGLAITRGNWKFAFARYHRSREFRGQQESPVYGSFTVSKRF